MGKDSRSPSPRFSRHKSYSRNEGDSYSSRRRSEKGYDRDQGDDERRPRDDKFPHRNRKEGDMRRGDDDRYGYGERERERERQRDRERYNDGARESGRDRDRRDNGRSHRAARRSASPPARTSRPRSPSGSVPRSPTEKDKAKPNFAPSGLLAAETNTVKAADGSKTVLKYNEPPEARKPVLGWRLYVFKDSEQVELLHIHRQSAYLIGRDRLVADIPVDHPSCSKQHAVIQYRYIREKSEFGDMKGVIKPFIIDLESTNGTHVNGEQIPAARYYELRASDVIKFGLSAKEYVLLHDDAS